MPTDSAPSVAPEALPAVLLVDDQEDDLRALQAILEGLPGRPVSVRSGAEALRHLEAEEFALVLLDLKMPGLSGLDVAQRLRRLEKNALTPILFQTGSDPTRELETAVYAVGAADLLVKPLRPAVVRAKVRVFLELGAARARQRRTELELREALRMLEVRSEQLEATAKELEAFGYTVGHDLRSPLRAIHGFAELLREEPNVSAEGRAALDYLSQCGLRLGRLVDELLTFNRLGRQTLHPARVDPTHVARQVASRLMAREAPRTVDLDIQPTPPCEADPAMVERLYEELIGNALKFTAERAPARIEVGGTLDDGMVNLFVRDNGCGFDPTTVHNAFGLFHRLHVDVARGGTGAGLAFAQRIVQRHGGRIWAESAAERGATLWFTLPTPSPQKPAAQ